MVFFHCGNNEGSLMHMRLRQSARGQDTSRRTTGRVMKAIVIVTLLSLDHVMPDLAAAA